MNKRDYRLYDIKQFKDRKKSLLEKIKTCKRTMLMLDIKISHLKKMIQE